MENVEFHRKKVSTYVFSSLYSCSMWVFIDVIFGQILTFIEDSTFVFLNGMA